MPHSHLNNQGHLHHSTKKITNAFVIGILLNLIFVIIEAASGLYTKSLSLITDAGHNLSDVASLALALLAAKLAEKKANNHYSFGYGQSTVLIALINGGLLLFALGAIVYEAVMRIGNTQPVQGVVMSIVAGVGIVINAGTAFLFMKEKDKDLNVKGAYLHMLSDALVSLGVVFSGLVILFTNWFWLDTIVSLLIVAIIFWNALGLTKEALKLSLNGVPDNIDLKEVKNYFLTLNGVSEIHDLHIWAISTTETALTVHLVMPQDFYNDDFYHEIKEKLFHKYNISHATIQIERKNGGLACGQES